MTIFKQQVNNFAYCLEARTLKEIGCPEKGLNETTGFDIYLISPTGERQIGRTYFSPFPGCCWIVVSHDTWLNETYRHSFVSDAFRMLKERIAKELGYSCMIATTQMSNIPAVKNFFKSNYRIVDTFTNKRTRNLIGIGIKKV